MNETVWYYKLSSGEFGPVTAEELKQLLTSGTLAPTDPVRADGSTEWDTVEQILRDKKTPSKITDLSELNFVFEENPPVPASETPNAGVSTPQNSSELESSSPQQAPASETENDDAAYYVETLGQILGPMPVSALVKMAESGALKSDERIRRGEDGEWCFPEVIPDVAVAIGSASTDRSTAAKAGKRRSHALPQEVNAVPTAPAIPDPQPVSEQPAAEKSARRTGSSSKGKSPGKAKTVKKRQRKTKKDDFLQEIFTEVFTEDGNVRDVAERPQHNKATAAAVRPGGEMGAPDRTTENATPAAASVPSVTAPSMANRSPAPHSKSSGPSAAPAIRRAAPARKSGAGISMPEPRTLSVIAVLVCACCLTGAFLSGVASLPGSSMDISGKLEPLGFEYLPLMSGEISEEKWNEYGDHVRAETGPVLEYLAAKETLLEQEKRYQQVSNKYLELVACKADDAKGQKVLFTEILALMK
ncbi:MAG: GYF domain-containing protein [Fuerstiella sp.]|nr:GYF domain-containing protein [Fuerstiella sp.]